MLWALGGLFHWNPLNTKKLRAALTLSFTWKYTHGTMEEIKNVEAKGRGWAWGWAWVRRTSVAFKEAPAGP